MSCYFRELIRLLKKVVVGPIGGPKEAQNEAKTLRKRRFQPLVQTLKRARRSFSTRCHLLGKSVNKAQQWCLWEMHGSLLVRMMLPGFFAHSSSTAGTTA
jgi:hypothetical protein